MNAEIQIVNNVLIRERIAPHALGSIWCIHGFAESGLSFKELLSSRLGKKFNLFVPDFPGFGVSPLQSHRLTLQDSTQLLVELITHVSGKDSIFIVAHSLGAVIGSWVSQELSDQVTAFFNIEGNLTAHDAYFSGQAAKYESATQFKSEFLKQIYKMAQGNEALQRYFGSVCFAHPEAMLAWGKASVRHSPIAGQEFADLDCAKLYYWGAESTPVGTQQFIKSKSIPNKCFHNSGHWPMIDQPAQCCHDILDFFVHNLD